jgi:stage III sporulation protein AB
MWFKIIGSILVVVAGTGLGFNLAARLRERPRQIRQLRNCLAILNSNIAYIAIPLVKALEYCTSGTEGAVGNFWRLMARILAANHGTSPIEALIEALQKERGLILKEPEIEALKLLAANLGSTNRAEQEKYINMVQDQLCRIEQDALAERDQNVKLFRYLGVCSSLAIIIIFI